MPTTTTTVPSGAQFVASLETSQDFFGRFNTDVGNYVEPCTPTRCPRTADYIASGGDTPLNTYGDHDFACDGPDTFRTLSNAVPVNQLGQYFWWCAPGGPGTGHVMTGFDTSGYAVVSFSPNQVVNNVSKVCWDINATDEGGGKWTNMIVVPEALYQQFAPRMDYVAVGFNQPNAPGDFNIQAGDHPGSDVWGVRDHRGGQHFYIGDNELVTDDTAHVTTDKMARYRHCVQRTSATTSTLTVDRPEGGTSTYQLPSAIPQGPVRVIFQDEMYDPPKRVGYDPTHITFHWDNVVIS